jgi:phospholipid N-methyltransferase
MQVATVCPSSSFVTDSLANRDCIREAQRIIELGPGAGGTTQAILNQMRPDARLLAIEKTRSFEAMLRRISDPRLAIHMGDATDLIQIGEQHQFGLADVVVSGIPFSALPEAAAKRITQLVHGVLDEEGVFIAYQMRDDVKRYAHELFGPPETDAIPFNLPPLNVFIWKKSGGQRSAADRLAAMR